MANQHTTTGRRIGLFVTSGLLLAAVGCGFPHGRYGGDPMLGNFNRPIAPTPPIWTGGDPGATPAYDGGARLGLPSPDVPAKSQPMLERMFIVPTYTGSLGFGKIFGGENSSAGSNYSGIQRTSASQVSAPAPAAPTGLRRAPGNIGANLLPPASPPLERSPNAVATANSVTPRVQDAHSQYTRGSAIEPILPPSNPISPIVAMKDPRQVATTEEGQSILTTCGATGQVMEQQPTGEWVYICTIGSGKDIRRYEAKSGDQLEAVRAVMFQVKKDQ